MDRSRNNSKALGAGDAPEARMVEKTGKASAGRGAADARLAGDVTSSAPLAPLLAVSCRVAEPAPVAAPRSASCRSSASPLCRSAAALRPPPCLFLPLPVAMSKAAAASSSSSGAAAPAAAASSGSSSLDALEGFRLLCKTSSGAQCVMVLQLVLKHPQIFVFGELLEMDSVKQVRRSCTESDRARRSSDSTAH